MEFMPGMRRKAREIYDILTGSTVEEQRDIMHEVQRLVNRRTVIPEYVRPERAQSLFEIADDTEQ